MVKPRHLWSPYSLAVESERQTKKCEICQHFAGYAFGRQVCEKGKRWPEIGKCKFFDEIDGGQGEN